MRCKFKLTEIHEIANCGDARRMVFTPQYDPTIPEDVTFNKNTPTGRLEMFVTNPAILEKVKVGQDYYIDATLIEAQ